MNFSTNEKEIQNDEHRKGTEKATSPRSMVTVLQANSGQQQASGRVPPGAKSEGSSTKTGAMGQEAQLTWRKNLRNTSKACAK